MADSTKDAPVKREHRSAAADALFIAEDVSKWVANGRSYTYMTAFCHPDQIARALANAERDVRAAIVERLRALVDGAHSVDQVGDLMALLNELEAASRG